MALPCLAYTHLQPAQLTTVGKRATLWMYELSQDIRNLEFQLENLMLLWLKGHNRHTGKLYGAFLGGRGKG